MAHTKNYDELIREFHSDAENGLTDEQVEINRAKYGENTFDKEKPESIFTKILKALSEPMTIMLIIAALLTFAINIVRLMSGKHTEFSEAIGILLAIVISTAITVFMENRSAKAFEALERLQNSGKVTVKRNGYSASIVPSEVVVGDILILGTGDKIAADGRIIKCSDFMCDEAPLTGESTPEEKSNKPLPENTPIAERRNMVYSGCFVTCGFGEAIVTGVGNNSEFGKIAGAISSSKKSEAPIQEKLAGLGKTIAVFGGAAAAFIFAFEVIRMVIASTVTFESVSSALISSVALLVASVPEGLPTIAAVTLAMNVIRMSKKNALVKKMTACETIGSVNVICTDKTGTLTENKMTVTDFFRLGSEDDIVRNICVNSTAEKDRSGNFTGNPTESALLTYCAEQGTDPYSVRDASDVAKVFPFSSEKKQMQTIVKTAAGYTSYIKGSPEKIMEACSMTADDITKTNDAIAASQLKAQRVIAFAHKSTADYDEGLSGYVFDGFASISDPIRREVYDAVKVCRSAGIDIKILTGDSLNTAFAIASELTPDMSRDRAFMASDIEKMSDDELRSKIDDILVIARSTPATKLRIVNMLKSLGKAVAVTGDGINDAPAIKSADVGIAMGITGTEVSKEAADIVLLDDSFSTISTAVRMGREIFESFRRFIKFQLTANLSSVAIVLISVILGFGTPFTPLQLLWINIIMDGPPALILGLLPTDKDLMANKPSGRTDSILTKSIGKAILVSGVYITLIIMLQQFTDFLGAGSEKMPTVVFTLFVMFQLFNSLNCVENKLFSKQNGKLFLTIAATALLQIFIVTVSGVLFNVVPLDALLWIKLIAVSATVLVIPRIIRIKK